MLRTRTTIAATSLLLSLGCSSGAGNTADGTFDAGAADGGTSASASPADDSKNPAPTQDGTRPQNDETNGETSDDPRRDDDDSPSPDTGNDGAGTADRDDNPADDTNDSSGGGSDSNDNPPLDPGSNSESDTACQITAPTPTDRDGDGLDDEVEEAGWEVTVEDGFGELNTRRVRSNPDRADSNGDGLCDREARQSFLDPNAEQGDTDGDGLSDIEERDRWASSPIDVDSDDDSAGDPRLFDGNEVQNRGTSPTLSDSDGDGISDYKEIVELGNSFDPLIANTPQLQARIVGAPNVRLNVIDSASNTQADTIETSLEQGSETNFSATDTQSHEAAVSLSATISTEVGYEGFSPSAKVGFEATATAGYTYTNTQSVTQGAVESSKQAYSQALEESRTEGREIDGGEVEVAVELTNVGDMTFTLGDYEITAILLDPNKPGAWRPLSTLSFSDQISDSGIGLGPGASAGPLVAAGQLTTEEALAVMARPELLRFEVANVALSYQNPDNGSARALLDFEYLRQETNAKTALVQVDFGNGSVIRRRVATNVGRQAGSITGISLDAALEVLGLDVQTETQGEAGVTKIASITDPKTDQLLVNQMERNYFWAIAGSTTRNFDSHTNLEDIRLLGGDAIYVLYVRDEDGDYLFAREEYLHGTTDDDPDFDDDGISDGDEVKVGWNAFQIGDDLFPPVAPYSENSLVFPRPTSIDGDRDGLSDPEEYAAGTDPANPDTDGDGYCDGGGAGPAYYPCPPDSDPDPLDPTVTGNRAPQIQNAELSASGLDVALDLNVTDADDNIVEVTIEWGDGQVSAVSHEDAGFGGYDAIRVAHTYADLGDYDVVVTARDAFNETDERTLETSAATPTQGLVAEYLFSAASVSDSSGNSNDAIIRSFYDNTGGCIFSDADRHGYADSSFYFNDNSRADGACWETDAYVETPALGLDTELSIAFWIRAPEDNGFILGQSNDNNPTQQSWAYFHYSKDEFVGLGANNRVNFILPGQKSAPIVLTDPDATADDTWTFYAVTVTTNGADSTATLYRGTEADAAVAAVATVTQTGDFSNPRPADPTYIGNLDVGGISQRMLLDDVRFFGRGLTEGELNALFR